MLLAHCPGYDVDVCAEEELNLLHACTPDDELQTVVVFAVQVFLVVLVAVLVGASAGEDVGQVDAEDDVA